MIYDHYLIRVDNVFDDLKEGNLIGRNNAWYIDQERDRYMRKVRKGLVIAKPTAYTDTNYQPIDPGVPNHRIYVGHDTLQTMALMGRKSATIQYYPSTKEQIDFISLADIGALVDAEVGETVYFHPNVTEPENLHEEHESYSVFKALPDALICVGTRMQAGWVLIEPHEDVTIDSGFILSVEPIHKMLEGTVRHIRNRPDLKPGDHVFFQEDSNWEYEVEGVKYYAMKEDNIWMKAIEEEEEDCYPMDEGFWQEQETRGYYTDLD